MVCCISYKASVFTNNLKSGLMESDKIKRHIEWLKRTYFSDPLKQMELGDGEILLRPGQYNERLFLITSGVLVGYIEYDGGSRYDIFRSGEGNLVGAYSFFSETHHSYATVVSEGPVVLQYLDRSDISGEDGWAHGEFAARILPVIVDEIYIRQLLAHRMSIENQETMKRLHQAEKLATLGEMAAGLAHELNNALGVILRKAEWLSERISEYAKEKDTRGLYPFFSKGLQAGQPLASTEVRRRKRELEQKFHLRPHLAKSLAKIGVSDQEVEQYLPVINSVTDRANYYYETGLALHDMLVAAKHAGKVVQSVRELGALNRQEPVPTDINQTIYEAMSLLENELAKVKMTLKLDGGLHPILVNASDWVQVWVNLLKNAWEALESSDTLHPSINVETRQEQRNITVRISDNGPGIPQNLTDMIFQPSFTTKKKGLSFGLGLGLSIVQKIIETYKGTISVNSRPGKTTFTVQIPTG